MDSNVIKLNKVREEVFRLSPEEMLNSIIRKEDFAVINGKIEPTRELALKLFALSKIDTYTCSLQQAVTNDKETVYVVKATVARQGKSAEGLGACSTLEIDRRSGQARHHHDALATAETRAYKRALEAVIGSPFINELILRLFGGYETQGGEKKQTPQISPDAFISKMQEAKAIQHLKNIWTKYSANVMLYDPKDQERVRKAKEAMKAILTKEVKNE